MPTDIATSATEVQQATINAPAGGDPRTAASVSVMGQGVTNRTLWLWKRLQEVIGNFAPISAASPLPVSTVDTVGNSVTITGHGISSNDAVHLVTASAATAPAGLAVGTQYYAIVLDANTLSFSTTPGPGAAVDITGGLSGNVYVVKNTTGDASIWATLNGILPAGTVRSMLKYISDHVAFDSTALGGPNTTAFAFNDITMFGSTNRMKVGSRTVTRVMRNDAHWDTVINGWNVSPGFLGDLIYVHLVTAAVLTVPLDLPDGATLSSLTVRFQGAAGHAPFPGGAPTMPFFVLKKIDNNGGVTPFGATTTDASGTAVAYEAAHNLTQAGINEVVDNATHRYVLAFTGEAGGNGIAGGLFYGITATCAMTSYPEW